MNTRLARWLIAWLWLGATSALAAPIDGTRDKPIYMDADRLGVDQKNALVVALGNVRVVQGQSILYADRIIYYQNQNIVRADGSVRVEDRERGETYFADEVQLKDDLMQGVIEQFRVRMADNSQFAAARAQRLSETQIKLDKAVYSPCKICEGESPFWQLKASEVDIDDAEQTVSYDDVTLELLGVPVAYAPYFSHPTPNADAKSGFLAPVFSQNSNLGFNLQTPYYWAIAPDKEAIITPFITTEEGLVMIGEYNQRFDDGFLEVEGSITYPRERDDLGQRLGNRELRGHIYALGQTALSDHWNAGFDLRRTTDDTYLRRYGFGAPRSLNSRIFTEGLYGRSFVSFEALAFQGLDAIDDPDLEPFVLPLAEAYYESDPGLFGLTGLRRFTHVNAQVIARQESTQSRRVSLTNGLKLPIATSGGHLLDITLQNRLDFSSFEENDFGEDGDEMRMAPTAAVKWRYPLIRRGASSTLTIEPTVLAIARPNSINESAIPNEDNRIVEFSDANLFRIDPFPGLDTVDDGSRIAYGFNGHWWMGGQQNLFFTVGQSFSVDDETPFPYNDDPGEAFSDYVGRVRFDYDPFAFAYRFRLDQDELRFNNQSIATSLSLDWFRLSFDYITFDDDAFLEDREELVGGVGIDMTDEWSMRAGARRDLLNDTMLSFDAGLTYQNDCFTLDTAFSRAFFEDRDLEEDTRFTVRVSLKNLAEFE